jgi:hypothetical protein
VNNFTLSDIHKLTTESLLEIPTGNPWLDARYDEQVGIIGHTNPYYRLFYRIAQQLKPEFVVELGSWRGDASAHFALGNPECAVIAVDIHKDNDIAGMAKLQEAVNLLPNMTWVQAWSWDAVETVKAVDKPISILFIDAWHDYKYAKLEWDLYSPLLASPSLVICDDITAGYNFEGMLNFWNELPGEKFLDNFIHVGVPMGFVKYVAKDRTPDSTESTQDTQPAPRKRGRKPRTA